jgi:hypothetical protein
VASAAARKPSPARTVSAASLALANVGAVVIVVVTSFRVLEVRRSDVVPGLGRSPFSRTGWLL